MQVETARAIADLINDRNQLTVKYTANKVLDAADNYLCRFGSDAQLLGVVEVRRVQWYQCEIDHLSVRADAEGRGIGASLVREAEQRIIKLGARIAQCTIRVGNTPSEALFRKCGYSASVTFFNARSGNEVSVYQNALVTR